MPGNILACIDTSHSLGEGTTSIWLIGTRDAAKYLQCSGQFLTPTHHYDKIVVASNVNSAKAEKFWHVFFFFND